jgi:hypothetical protein
MHFLSLFSEEGASYIGQSKYMPIAKIKGYLRSAFIMLRLQCFAAEVIYLQILGAWFAPCVKGI